MFAAHLLTGLLQIEDARPERLLHLASQAWMLQRAALFGIAHAGNPHATALSVFSNSLGGVTYALPYIVTGSPAACGC